MPTYEYRCNACKREFEVQQRMVDDDLVHCDVCGKDALEKLISHTAFQFKGGGWYKDLYSSSKPDSGGGEKASAAPAASSTESSSAPAATPAPAAAPSTPSTPASSGSSGSGSSGGSTSSAAS